MRLGRLTRGAAVASLAAAAWLAVPPRATAQQGKTDAAGGETGKGTTERAAGVIVKMKDGAKAGDRGASRRLSINTNAVWRDWARDQAQMKDNGSAKKDARKGSNSVATVGEPADLNSVVVVEIGPDTKVETRFRAADDETGRGSKAPETPKGSGGDKTATAAPVQFHAEDLKPGLFVEVDFRQAASRNSAARITVIRPIGGPDSGVNAAGAVDKAK